MNKILENKSLMWGLITGLSLILISVIGTTLKLEANRSFSIVTYLIFFAGIFMSVKTYLDAKGSSAGFGELFSIGFKTTSILTLLNLVFLFISLKISPEIKTQAIEKMVEAMEQNKAPQETIDKIMPMMENNFTMFMVASMLFGLLLFGVIASLVTSAILHKKQDPFTTNS